jgi:hypothetical protein
VCTLKLSSQAPSYDLPKLIQNNSEISQKVLDNPLTLCYYLLVGWLIRHKGIEMTLENALKAVNENLEKFRLNGDVRAFDATMVMKDGILKMMGVECAEEYEKKYG